LAGIASAALVGFAEGVSIFHNGQPLANVCDDGARKDHIRRLYSLHWASLYQCALHPCTVAADVASIVPWTRCNR